MKNKIYAFWVMFCCLLHGISAQEPIVRQDMTGPWKDIQELRAPKNGNREPMLPQKFRLLEADIDQLKDILSAVPTDFAAKAFKPTILFDLPLPDGSSRRFEIYNDPVMAPDLALRYPEIQTFAGHQADDPEVTIRLDLSPHGFNAQVLSAKSDAIYVAPVVVGDNRHHISYYKKDSRREDGWSCLSGEHGSGAGMEQNSAQKSAGDCGTRREYRLALAATGEYTTFHGGTVALALAAMNTTMNRVNGVYERDCSIRMNIIGNTDLLIYTDASTDPYTNGNPNTMIGENQTNVDAVIGTANYDIGHVFGTNSGGLASLGVVCSGSKARGVTGSGAPIGDAFDIDYVAHEMGHQFNAEHTFNESTTVNCSPGNLSGPSAFEPGSGSTIMAYAGICSPVDVQSNSDAYFHAISLQQIGNFVVSGGGSGCASPVPVSNLQPSVNAGADFIIPVSTAFRLTAAGADPNGNALTFCWEQMDNQLISHPPASTATGGPVFRSFTPVSSPVRYFPRLPVILDNTLPSTWEVLPSVSRILNFRVTARDNFTGGGCTDEDDMVVNVDATAGPFVMTAIGTSDVCLFADDNTVINWNVANTTAPPVSCANVDIWLSLDGGQNFSILLADNVPNDGSQSVAIPANAITTQGRIMVICSDNIFLDINNDDVVIDCPANITVTDNPASGAYRSRDRLETMGNVTIAPATSAQFFAGDEIILRPGFWAQHGSDFLARIQACDPCTGTKPDAALAGKENPNVYFYDAATGSRSKPEGETGPALKASVYPNPFDQNFTVTFETATAGKVYIQLIDVTGRSVRLIYQNDQLDAGIHRIPVYSNQLESGVYDCRIISEGRQEQVKIVKMD
ncbi:MAG: T9SS type A sorting domain-containing protein [Lewinellaceae bacterium]|nr:T9SS type A sorting domain-containing protein [Lewinellaceae bacterium]